MGITWPSPHDNCVAAIVDGKLVFATEEERHTRHKYSVDEPPVNSLVKAFLFLREKYGISPSDITDYAVNYNLLRADRRLRRYYYLKENFRFIGDVGFGTFMRRLPIQAIGGYRGFSDLCRETVIRGAYRRLGLDIPPGIRIHPVDHHLAHAASAYHFSGCETAAVLTVDGSGESESTVLWSVRNGDFEKLETLGIMNHSLGYLYEGIGELLGFSRLSGPGKVMGLAPYGSRNEAVYGLFRRFIRDREGSAPYFLDIPVSHRGKDAVDDFDNYHTFLGGLFGGLDLRWTAGGELNRQVTDVAYAVQDLTEHIVLSLAEEAKRATGAGTLCMAGGVALNAKANMRVYYSRLFDDLFIFPAANDAGAAIGAASAVYEEISGSRMERKRLEDVYLGPEYTEEHIRSIVKKGNWRASYIADEVSEVSKLVSQGRIVTWFTGRSELGPRALGHRSIVADPRRKEMWTILNTIKGREWWRPLAPSLLFESMDDYFTDPSHHPFMVLMYSMKPSALDRTPAVYHVDGTARPQTVKQDVSPAWHKLIKSFGEETGESLVVNTSFNLAGEPLVESPEDALRSFSFGGFDALYLDGWLIRK